MDFDDFNDDFDDIGLLTAASHVWHTPAKQKIIKDISALSPNKRQPALAAKLKTLSLPRQESVPPDDLVEDLVEDLEEDLEEVPEEDQEKEATHEQSAGRERQSQSPASFSNPPTLSRSSPPPPRSDLNIASDPTRGSLFGSDYLDDEYIKDAGALTKSRPSGSRVVALSGRERWTLKDKSDAEQAAWKIIFTALRIDYINEGPPPPDEERDSRLTNDSRLRAIIDSRYRQAFDEHLPALAGLEIEAVSPRSRLFNGRPSRECGTLPQNYVN